MLRNAIYCIINHPSFEICLFTKSLQRPSNLHAFQLRRKIWNNWILHSARGVAGVDKIIRLLPAGFNRDPVASPPPPSAHPSPNLKEDNWGQGQGGGELTGREGSAAVAVPPNCWPPEKGERRNLEPIVGPKEENGRPQRRGREPSVCVCVCESVCVCASRSGILFFSSRFSSSVVPWTSPRGDFLLSLSLSFSLSLSHSDFWSCSDSLKRVLRKTLHALTRGEELRPFCLSDQLSVWLSVCPSDWPTVRHGAPSGGLPSRPPRRRPRRAFRRPAGPRWASDRLGRGPLAPVRLARPVSAVPPEVPAVP